MLKLIPYMDKARSVEMYRIAMEDLKKWFQEENSKPLVMRGARQVGKSTLVRNFCKHENIKLVEINLEKKKISQLENQEDFDIEKVISEIELSVGEKITKNTILFLDEIQAQPIAFNRLRYFYEDKPCLKVIAAGSLLDVIMEQENFSMPVGRVEYYYLGPMTFLEFLMAKNEKILCEQINNLDINNPPSTTLFKKASQLLKEYYFVGGMPEVIKKYIDSGDMESVRKIQYSLLQTYRDDIPKYTKNKQMDSVGNVFEYVPANLGQKVIFRNISNTHSGKIKESINLLSKAGVIYKIVHTNSSGLPLKAGEDENIYKLFFLDIGLSNAMMEVQWKDIYYLSSEKLLLKGNMAEQFIAQHLMFRNSTVIQPALHYWLRGGKKNAAEVDFIISHASLIYPIEVKAGSTGKMRSLWQFVSEKESDYAIRFDLVERTQMLSTIKHKVRTSNGIVDTQCNLLSLPLFAIEKFTHFLDQL